MKEEIRFNPEHDTIPPENKMELKMKVRNYLVKLVVTKSGAGRHRNKKREAKNKHYE